MRPRFADRSSVQWLLATSAIGAFIGAVSAPGAAAAAEQTTATRSSDGGAPVIEEVVVTAQRREQAISQVPISVQAITAERVERAGQDTRSLVALSPSVTYRSGYNANSSGFTIRGVNSISINGGVQPSTAMVIDNMPIYRQGEFIADLGDVDRVEVLRGPQGTLFGKNATAGVINIVRRRPADTFGGEIEAGGTNDKEWWTRGIINIPINSQVRLRMNGFYRNQAPLLHTPNGVDLAWLKSFGGSIKLAVDITPDLDWLLTASYAQLRQSYGQHITIIPSTYRLPNGALLGPLKQAATGIRGGYGNTDINTDLPAIDYNTSRGIISEFNWHASDNLVVTSITGFRIYKSNNRVDVDGTPVGFKPGVGFTPNPTNYPIATMDLGMTQPERDRYGSQEVRLTYTGDRTSVVSGVFYQDVQVDAGPNITPLILNGAYLGFPSSLNFINISPYFYRLQDRTAAAFADVTYKWNDQISTFGGLRYTAEKIKFNYRRTAYFTPVGVGYNPNNNTFSVPGTKTEFLATDHQNSWTGRFGVQWRPTEGQNYYVSYNRGYKGPAVDGSGSPNRAETAITRPEIARAYEIGTKQRMLDGRLAWALALFDQRIKDIQQTGVVPGTVITQLVNAGDLETKGVEAEFQFAATSELRLSGGVTYLDAKYDSGSARTTCNASQTAGLQGGCVNGTQSLTGVQAISSPKWRYNLTLDYQRQLNFIPASLAFTMNWIWTDDMPFTPDADPLTVEPSHGFLTADATITSNDKHWEFRVFGRNLTNEFYYITRSSANTIIDRGFGYVARDFRPYGGISVKYKY